MWDCHLPQKSPFFLPSDMLMTFALTSSRWSHNGRIVIQCATSECMDHTGNQAQLQEPGSHGESGDWAGVTDGGKAAADMSKGKEDCLVLRDLTLFWGKPATWLQQAGLLPEVKSLLILCESCPLTSDEVFRLPHLLMPAASATPCQRWYNREHQAPSNEIRTKQRPN